jgi:hypothetical protein
LLILIVTMSWFYSINSNSYIIASGDVTIDEFTVMMNQYVPTSTLGLRDLFNTFGKGERETIATVFFCFIKIWRFKWWWRCWQTRIWSSYERKRQRIKSRSSQYI